MDEEKSPSEAPARDAPAHDAERVQAALERLRACSVCPRACGVDRLQDEKKFCRTGRYARVASASCHFGEEPPLTGRHGSGTIFFAGCNLACVFCQNYDISQREAGETLRPQELASVMLRLEALGCHNINWVSPSHVAPQALEALVLARREGLRVPVVYNSGGYDHVDTLKVLEGYVDVYMPDFKYAENAPAEKFSLAPDYADRARETIREMHRQVGDLVIDENGLAAKGLLVRHLVLPGGLAGTKAVMRFLAEEISSHTYVNVMAQYHPANKAHLYRELSRRTHASEWREAVACARAFGLHRGLD